MKKKKLALWAGIIGASCLFGAAMALFGITGDARTIALVLWSVVIITVYAIVTMSDGRKTVAKIQEVNRLLTEDHNIEGYIAGLNRDNGTAVDATCGRKTKAVLVMDSGHILLSALLPETIAKKIEG